MKKLAILITCALLVLTNPALAAGGEIKVHVNGLVCDFCARALEKVFSKQEAVEKINVDLTTKIVTIDFKEGQTLSDETVTGLINDSGYSVEKIEMVEAGHE